LDQSSTIAYGIIQGYSYYTSEGGIINGRSNTIAWSKDKTVTTNAIPEATVTPGITTTPTTNASTPTTTPVTPATTVVECVEAFTECNFTGTSVKLCDSDSNFEWRKYKSLKIPSSKNVIIYGSDNYQG